MEQFNQKGGLQDKIGNHASPDIPPTLQWEQLSEGIMAGIEPKRKRRRFFFLWWLLGLLACSGGVYAYFNVLEWNIDPPIEFSPKNLEFNQQEVQDEICPEIPIAYVDSRLVVTNENIAANITTRDRSVSALLPLESKAWKAITLPHPVSLPISSKRFICESVKLLITDYDSLTPVNYPLNTSLIRPKRKVSSWQIEFGVATNYFESNYKEYSDNYETTLMAWQADFRLQKRIVRQWGVQAGVQWQELRYRSNLYQEELVNLYRPNTIDTIFTNQDTWEQTFVYRDSLPGIRIHEFQHYNKHSALQIPLLLTYERAVGAWSYSLRTGVNLQLRKQSKGRTAINQRTIIDLEQDDYFDKGIRWSTVLELQCTYQFSDRAALFVRMGGEQHLQNWLQTDFNYTQYPRVVYGGFGLRWNL